MDFNLTVEQQQIRDEIRKVCKEFPDGYWREVDHNKSYPDAFVRKLSELGWLAALIPEEYGGSGLTMSSAIARLASIAARVSQAVVAQARPADRFTSRLALQKPGACSSRGSIPTRSVSVIAPGSPCSQLTRQHSP